MCPACLASVGWLIGTAALGTASAGGVGALIAPRLRRHTKPRPPISKPRPQKKETSR
jgi:hypothetical protein